MSAELELLQWMHCTAARQEVSVMNASTIKIFYASMVWMLRWQLIALVHAKSISALRSRSCMLTELLVSHYSIPL
jgi:hypothetical protein